jgi:hypothetical protein
VLIVVVALAYFVASYQRKRSGAAPRRVVCGGPLYSLECVERLYEKPSNTDEPPRHEANHGSIYERLAARTQPLVIFAHPPVLVDPRNSPFHYPSTRQNLKAWRRQ